jgi:hypothetical protein
MPVRPRLAGIAAALLLLASPLSASLPEETSWTMTGLTRVVSHSGSASSTKRWGDTVHLALPGSGAFSLVLESEPAMVYEGTLVEDGMRTLLVVGQESQQAYYQALLAGLAAAGVPVVESSAPAWSMRARVARGRTGEEMRLKVSMRWRVTAGYAGRTKRIGIRMDGNYRGPGDA